MPLQHASRYSLVMRFADVQWTCASEFASAFSRAI